MKKITTVVKEYDTEGRLIKETTTEETEEETITTKEYIPYPVYPYIPQTPFIPVWTSPTIRPHRELEITWGTDTGSGTYTPPSFINTNTVFT